MSVKSAIHNLYAAPLRFASNIFDPPAVILIYHRVTDLEFDYNQLAVSPENFNDQISYLTKNYNVVTAEEFYALITSRKKFPKHTALLTFDDGYADNLLEALPILEAYNAQAIFYITTSHLNTDKELWWDELERIFLTDFHLPESIIISDGGNDYTLKTSTVPQRIKIHNRWHKLFKSNLPDRREYFIENLKAWAELKDSGRSLYRMLTFEELKKLHVSKSAVIGAHTHTHTVMSLLTKEQQLSEMQQSKDILEKLLNTKIEHASYPFGTKKDFNEDSIEVSKQLNFKMTCANYHFQVHRWSNIHALPRILVRDWNLQEFKKQVARFYCC